MTSVDPSGSARPGRVAGLALLGVAAVALVIGLVTVFGGDGSGNAADGKPPSSSDTSTSGKPTSRPRPPATTTRPPTSTTKPPATTTSKPGSTTTKPSDGGDQAPEHLPLRVYNNSKIKGLAHDAAADLRAGGWDVTEVGNYGSGIIPTTTVYFRPNTAEEADARELATTFGMRAEARFEGIQDAPDGLIVIVTSDYQGQDGKDGK